MKDYKRTWIIAHSYSEHTNVEFSRFYGSEAEMKELLKSMAAEVDPVKEVFTAVELNKIQEV